MDYGHPVWSGAFNTGPAPAHPIGLGAHKPRTLSLVGLAAGRGPSAIFPVLKGSAHLPVELFTPLTVEGRMDTHVIGSLEEADALCWFGSDVVAAVREAVVAPR
jgi:hypothetical protein